jgi:hypothetical protein
MFNDLKKSIHKYKEQESVNDSVLENSVDVKDIFLNDPDIAVIGAENDPEIKKLVSNIPEYDHDNEDIEEKVENVVENMLVEI